MSYGQRCSKCDNFYQKPILVLLQVLIPSCIKLSLSFFIHSANDKRQSEINVQTSVCFIFCSSVKYLVDSEQCVHFESCFVSWRSSFTLFCYVLCCSKSSFYDNKQNVDPISFDDAMSRTDAQLWRERHLIRKWTKSRNGTYFQWSIALRIAIPLAQLWSLKKKLIMSRIPSLANVTCAFMETGRKTEWASCVVFK